MTSAQEMKVNLIKKELEDIAHDCGGALNEFFTEELGYSVAVHFKVSQTDGTYYDFKTGKRICLENIVFIGVRGGMHYVYFPKKTDGCSIRYAKNIRDMVNQTKKEYVRYLYEQK
jgi:hypothetical protein